MALPGGLGAAGLLVFLVIQLLSSGGASGFGVDRQFGDAPRAPGAGAQGIPAAQDPDRDLKDFSSYVFTHSLDAWEDIFRAEGRRFERAKLVLYRDAVATACGDASSAVGRSTAPRTSASTST